VQRPPERAAVTRDTAPGRGGRRFGSRPAGLRHPANRRRFEQRTRGEQLADQVTGIFGSWRFIIAQTIAVAGWIALNLLGFADHWDPYPFILLNLLFSTQAAYAAPLILLSQNRQSDTDRIKAEHDYRVNQLALGYLVAWHRDTHGRDCRCVQEAVDDEPMIDLQPDAVGPPRAPDGQGR
jgi:Protein of unknown function (DUF1003)